MTFSWISWIVLHGLLAGFCNGMTLVWNGIDSQATLGQTVRIYDCGLPDVTSGAVPAEFHFVKTLKNPDTADEYEYIISNGDVLDGAFNIQRYTITVDQQNGTHLSLQISDLKIEDAGGLGCKTSDKNPHRFTSVLNVISAVDIVGYSSGEEVELSTKRALPLTCTVTASNPDVNMEIFLGSDDITNKFDPANVTSNGIVPTSPDLGGSGLFATSYTISRSTDSLVLDDNNGGTLQCRSYVEGQPGTWPPGMEDTIDIKVVDVSRASRRQVGMALIFLVLSLFV